MKTRIYQGLCVLACSFAGLALAQEPAAIRTTETTTTTTQTQLGAPMPTVLKVSQVQVKDNAGQILGTVEDLVLSPQGCVDMAILSVGGTKLVPVPWQIVRTDHAVAGATVTAQPTLTVQVDRTKLMQAPTIERATLHTQIREPAFASQLHTFYGVQANVGGRLENRLGTRTDTSIGTTPGQPTTTPGLGTSPTGRTNSIFRSPGFGRPPGATPTPTPTPDQPSTIPSPQPRTPGLPSPTPPPPSNPSATPNTGAGTGAGTGTSSTPSSQTPSAPGSAPQSSSSGSSTP